MVDSRSLRRIRSATVVVVVVVVIVLVVCVVRVVVHGVGRRAAVQATAAWPVVAGRRRIVSSGGGGGGPRAVGSPCGSKNEGKNQRGEKTATKGVVECAANGRGALGAGSDVSDVDGVHSVILYR